MLPDALEQTVAEYNDALASERTANVLQPPRQTGRYKALPIVKAPFYAMPMCAGITYTMGGIRVNEHARALRADGTPIEGLYALGSSTGGLEGGPAVGYTGGLAKSGVTALIAAEHVAERMRGRAANVDILWLTHHSIGSERWGQCSKPMASCRSECARNRH